MENKVIYYLIKGYDEKNKLVYTLELTMTEKKFEKQIQRGYIDYYDKKLGRTIVNLNRFASISIREN